MRKGVRVIRGRIKNAVALEGKVTRCSVLGLAEEQIDDVDLFGDHGSSAVPDDDSECVALQFGHRTIVIAGADRRIAPAMESGDVAIHNDTNQYVVLKKNGGIDIRTSGNVTVHAGEIRLGDETLTSADGIVTRKTLCAYTGLAHGGSNAVMAKGGDAIPFEPPV